VTSSREVTVNFSYILLIIYRKEEPIQRITARWKEMEQKNLSSDVFDARKGSEIVEKVKLTLVIFLMLLFFLQK
jgi:hypothetical protein